MDCPYPELNVPIFFSVTGHRDIPKELHGSLIEHLKGYFKTFSDTHNKTRIVLMSALADGGDRIAAKAAIGAGIDLMAILPMPQNIYEGTFYENVGSVEEFRYLLSRCKYGIHVLPSEADPEKINEEEQYRELGKFFVMHSHILIALWDSKPPKMDGGTADVVAMARFGVDWGSGSKCGNGVCDNHLDMVDNCLTYCIKTPRKEVPDGWTLESRFILPIEIPGDIGPVPNIDEQKEDVSEELPEAYHSIFKRINTMNMDALLKNNQRKTRRRESDRRIMAEGVTEDLESKNTFYLLSGIDGDKTDEIMASDTMRTMAGRFALADRLALKYQKISFFRKYVYLMLVVISNFFLMAYLTFSENIYLVTGYVLFLFLGMVLFWHTVKRKKRIYHFKFLEYRQLAEVMRVHFYWTLVGVRRPMSDIFHEYLREPTTWIRSVMVGWSVDILGASGANLSDKEKVEVLKDAWIDDQAKYHLKKRRKNAKRMSGLSTLEKLFLLLSAGASLVIMGVNLISPDILNLEGGMDIALTLLALSTVVFVTNIISKTMMTVRTSYIHGGSPKEIDLKKKVFDVTSKRLERILGQCDGSGELSKIAAETCEHIFYELGVMEIEECNSWSETHIVKDMTSAGIPGRNL